MPTRYYSSVAEARVLAAAAAATDTALTVNYVATTGWPTVPYTAALERSTGNQELVLVTAYVAVGTTSVTLTVSRGYDGSTAVAHATGARIEHVSIAMDFREAQLRLDDVEAYGLMGTV